MAEVTIPASRIAGVPPEQVALIIQRLGQGARAAGNDVIVMPRASSHRWLDVVDLADAQTQEAEFTERFKRIDPAIDIGARLDVMRRAEARGAIERWLEKGDFGQVAAKLTDIAEPDERHLWLRELVKPVFFAKYPKGKMLAITLDPRANSYLALLNTLQKMQRSHSPGELQGMAGQNPLSSFSLNVPAELMWLGISMLTMMHFPSAATFVATCAHQFFLIFVTNEPVAIGQGDERYAPFAREIPRVLSVLDSTPDSSSLRLASTFVREKRRYPFDRRRYSASELETFMRSYVEKFDKFNQWLCDLTNYHGTDGSLDVQFALQTYLTIYMILSQTIRIVAQQADMFARKMAFFDVLELFAALIDSSSVTAQAEAWKTHLEAPFIAEVIDSLRTYPSPIADDLIAGTNELLAENLRIVRAGVFYGSNPDGTITLPNHGTQTLDEFMIHLLRGLRNTKHGFATRDADYLASHTCDFGNDLPDFAMSLWLHLISDRGRYSLKHKD